MGFVKVALENGACLVPVYSFGETDIYEGYKVTGRVKKFMAFLQAKMGFAMPLIYGRSLTGGIMRKWFGFKKGIFPLRTPIFTVVGAPIECTEEGKPGRFQAPPELVEKYHKMYMESVWELYDGWKP